MTWGNDIAAWIASDDGWRILSGAVIPALAIVSAGVVAALIGRGSTKRLLRHHDRDALTSAIGAFVLAGRTAAEWHDHGEEQQLRTNRLIADAETRLRLLPARGSALAANWAAHQLESMKRNSSGFRFQAQQTLIDYRDALITWSQKPRTAKKLFGADLERWRYEGDEVEDSASTPTSAPEVSVVPTATREPSTYAEPRESPRTETPATTGPISDPALAAALAAAPPPSAHTAASPSAVDDAEGAPQPKAASVVRDRITSTDHD